MMVLFPGLPHPAYLMKAPKYTGPYERCYLKDDPESKYCGQGFFSIDLLGQ